MKLAIMQPYFMPYIGYFQLIAAVDRFVIYDNIQYTKKGWINRNRLLQNGKDVMFSLPLQSGSNSLDICERTLAADFNRDKLLKQLRGAYQRAPHFEQIFPLMTRIMHHEDDNLFGFLHHAIVSTCEHLGLGTEIMISSSIPIDHTLKSQAKVLAICEALGATNYINAIGGTALYEPETFRARGIELKFIRSKPFSYAQFGTEFVPWLSIIDVMMFNHPDTIRACIESNYELT